MRPRLPGGRLLLPRAERQLAALAVAQAICQRRRRCREPLEAAAAIGAGVPKESRPRRWPSRAMTGALCTHCLAAFRLVRLQNRARREGRSASCTAHREDHKLRSVLGVQASRRREGGPDKACEKAGRDRRRLRRHRVWVPDSGASGPMPMSTHALKWIECLRAGAPSASAVLRAFPLADQLAAALGDPQPSICTITCSRSCEHQQQGLGGQDLPASSPHASSHVCFSCSPVDLPHSGPDEPGLIQRLRMFRQMTKQTPSSYVP